MIEQNSAHAADGVGDVPSLFSATRRRISRLTGIAIIPGDEVILTFIRFASSISSVASSLVIAIVLLKWTCLPARIALSPLLIVEAYGRAYRYYVDVRVSKKLIVRHIPVF